MSAILDLNSMKGKILEVSSMYLFEALEVMRPVYPMSTGELKNLSNSEDWSRTISFPSVNVGNNIIESMDNQTTFSIDFIVYEKVEGDTADENFTRTAYREDIYKDYTWKMCEELEKISNFDCLTDSVSIDKNLDEVPTIAIYRVSVSGRLSP